ncbi:hypothetical protein BG004_006595, partial [Podila humilis]
MSNNNGNTLGAVEEVRSNPGSISDKDCLDPLSGQNQFHAGVSAWPILSSDHVRTGKHSYMASMLSTNLEDPLKSQLLTLTSGNGSDLATAMLVAWTVVLSQLSGQKSINVVVGKYDQAGSLVAPCVWSFELSGELSTAELLERVKLATEKERGHQTPTQGSVHFSMNKDSSLPKACFYSHDGEHLDDTISMQHYLELHLIQHKEGVSMNIRYATDLYTTEAVERHAGYLRTVLMNMVVKTQPLDFFDFISTAEKKLLVQTGDGTEFGEIQVWPLEHTLVRDAVDSSIDYEDEDDDQMSSYVGADPRALSAPVVSSSITRDYVAPQGEIEMALAEMSTELLKVPCISRDDDFFELGGHSIAAIRLMNSVAARYGTQLPMSSFFAAPTLHALAEAVNSSIGQD